MLNPDMKTNSNECALREYQIKTHSIVRENDRVKPMGIVMSFALLIIVFGKSRLPHAASYRYTDVSGHYIAEH